MSSHRHPAQKPSALTMHGWTAKHWVITAVVFVLAIAMFAYSWS